MRAGQGAAATDGAERKAILLAEDDAVNRAIVRHLLSELPAIDVVEAGDGREALERALERRFDLLIVDQNMPHIPGDRLIRHLRASRNPNGQTPIIRFSAHNSGAVAASDRELFLPKPIRGEEFLAAVQTCLGLGGPPPSAPGGPSACPTARP